MGNHKKIFRFVMRIEPEKTLIHFLLQKIICLYSQSRQYSWWTNCSIIMFLTQFIVYSQNECIIDYFLSYNSLYDLYVLS